ncbi:MAG: hypothetical protein WKG07_32960 [Hymenobacter sp.]
MYSDVNHALWRLYQSNKVTQKQLREIRFVRTLTKLGVAEADMPVTISARVHGYFTAKSRPCFRTRTRCWRTCKASTTAALDYQRLRGRAAPSSWLRRSSRSISRKLLPPNTAAI